jgi:hypothetical protein
MWIVMHVHTDISVESVYGDREDFKLSWANGMLGVLPIFGSKSAAEAYSKGRAFVEEVDIMEAVHEV